MSGPHDDFDDQTEMVGPTAPRSRSAPTVPERLGFRPPQGANPSVAELSGLLAKAYLEQQRAEEEPGGFFEEEEEATQVVQATDVGGFFGERFRVDARLGVGAMGRVLTAIDTKTGGIVALKLLHKDRAKDPHVVERFRREAAVLREIQHPAIVKLVAFDRAPDGTWWLAMEHLRGQTLKDRIHQGGPYTPQAAWPILATLCDGLAAAHRQGILHRDLKPENVLVLGDSSGGAPCKILDFGLSRYTSKPDRITATGTLLGTPRYMAPELLSGGSEVDARSDVFAMGVIAFEMLTGRSIYPAEDFGQLFGCILEGRTLSLRSVRPDASPELEQAIAHAVAKSLDARTPSVEAFASEMARAIGVAGPVASVSRTLPFTPSIAPPRAGSTGPLPVVASGPVGSVPLSGPRPSFSAPPAPMPPAMGPGVQGPPLVASLPPGPHPSFSPPPAPPLAPQQAAPSSWRWFVLFALAALVTMLVAGGAAFFLRAYFG